MRVSDVDNQASAAGLEPAAYGGTNRTSLCECCCGLPIRVVASVTGIEPACVQLPFRVVRNHRGYTEMVECNNSDCKKPAAVKYCSMRCAAIVNNRTKPKRAKTSKQWNLCVICGDLVRGRCHQKCRIAKSLGTSLAEYAERSSAKGQLPSWRYAHVRTVCRTIHKELKALPCQVCGYSKHVELAHIKPVSSFDPSTPIGIVHDASNILVLCGNHHWEFDHGLLAIDQIPKRVDPTPGIKPGSSA